ncbi:restriction endonuclease subunit S [Clostridium tyrobutyricum]|uniref:restriction endonuclease subunit S n=1 Tax=Clostridium tyrobutyricum TaxID=1519 RepID=UPI0020CB7E49|nr:restriction endonuclease subunit S [Clostridium tyrobutyricum]
MDKNKANVPKIRFPGFTDPWEQRKLKQLANFAKGQGYSKNDLTDVGTPIILYGRLYTKYQSSISEVDTFAVPQSGSVYSTGEEVIVPASGETAEDIARASAVVKSGFLLGGDLNIIYPNKDISTIFLALSISNGKQQKELSKKAQGKSVVHLHNSDLEEVTISFPCKEEQEKIESVFAHLDNLITLHQRKLNHLQDKKKSLLQKMFPKNDEDFPELRFPGFTDPWEQRKLKQLANFAKGQGYSKNDLTDVGTPIILYGRLYTKYQSSISEVDTFAVPQSGSVYSTGEEVIVPASGETAEDIARASAVVKSGFLLGGDLNIIYPNKDISTIFLALSISNGKQQKELSKKAQGKSVVHLHNSDLEEVTISFPCKEEQEKIESVFAHLDNLITLHQRKLNHLQEQKKALLQQMFV